MCLFHGMYLSPGGRVPSLSPRPPPSPLTSALGRSGTPLQGSGFPSTSPVWILDAGSLGTSIRHKAGTSQGGSSSQECLAAATPSQCHALPVQNCGLESPSETSSGYSIPFPQQEATRAAAKQTEITPSAHHRARGGQGGGSGAAAELKYSLEIRK